MAIFEWKSEYDTGISEIDIQHMVLFSIINDLHILVNKHFDRVRAVEILQQLKSYALHHFATEDGLMEQYHYEEINHDAHLVQHREFEGRFESLLVNFDSITLDECNDALLFLTNWLINHIGKVDQRLAQHILGQRQTDNQDVSYGGDVSSSNLIQNNVRDTDEILEHLGACIDELKNHCDATVWSAPSSDPSNISSNSLSESTHGPKLVQSIKSHIDSLKSLLDQFE